MARSLVFLKVLRRLHKRPDAASGGSDLTGRECVRVGGKKPRAHVAFAGLNV